jgi:hypothetical protein
MFGSKKDRQSYRAPFLCLYDENMKEIFRDKLHAFPLPEAVVLAYSEELFGDPEPCEIHRRAVQVRIYGEIAELLPQDEIVRAADLPDRVCLYYREFRPAFVRLESGS